MPRTNRISPARTPPAANSNLPAVQTAPKKSIARSTGGAIKEMAAQMAGMAAGSAVGHAVGSGIVGLFRDPKDTVKHSTLVPEGPCAFEMKQFLKCTEENADLSVCKEFNDAVRNCHKQYNL
ncbi:hypothetical protein KR018_003668 [Drosophila ironensis]|nr:hypothetical protein KR018_003668 [Drosophila ironensis]